MLNNQTDNKSFVSVLNAALSKQTYAQQVERTATGWRTWHFKTSTESLETSKPNQSEKWQHKKI